MLLTVDEIEIARFGATTAVLHAFLSRFDNLDGMPIAAFADEASVCVGIYGEVFKRSLRKLENAGFIQIDDGKIYNMIAVGDMD